MLNKLRGKKEVFPPTYYPRQIVESFRNAKEMTNTSG